MILPCICSHTFQDKKYGSGNRVHNPNTKGSNCTVCGATKNTGAVDKPR